MASGLWQIDNPTPTTVRIRAKAGGITISETGIGTDAEPGLTVVLATLEQEARAAFRGGDRNVGYLVTDGSRSKMFRTRAAAEETGLAITEVDIGR